MPLAYIAPRGTIYGPHLESRWATSDKECFLERAMMIAKEGDVLCSVVAWIGRLRVMILLP